MLSAPDPAEPGISAGPAGDEWWQVSLEAPRSHLETVTAIFERVVSAGVVVEWPFEQGEDFGTAEIQPEAAPIVSCFFPAGAAVEQIAELRAQLSAAGLTCESRKLEQSVRRKSDWETAFHRHLRAIRVGWLLVRPRPCADVLRAGEIVVELEPGLAFGTGSHPTTQMALAGVERLVRPGSVVLDFGTGSGVLACAAARLGAGAVLALDIDPNAVLAARRNAALNAAHVVRVCQADAPPDDAGAYDLVVANISAGIVVSALPRLAAATRPGGDCLLGGIIEPQLGRVREALSGTSLVQQKVESDGEWRTVYATRTAHLR